MKIAIDAMGGDHAPGEVVAGAVAAARAFQVEMLLAGPEDRLRAELARHDAGALPLQILPASEQIGFDEPPVAAIRKKTDSSLVRALRAVRDGEAAAAVSAGSTGALLAGGLLVVGRVRGVDRPALATPLPMRTGVGLLLDVGANADCTAQNLLQFARMGAIYAERVLGLPDPTVGLLSVGTEEAKGSALTRAALPLLQGAGLNFVGNVEAREVFDGRARVVVTDGFSGNVLLKTAEGAALRIFELLREQARGSIRYKAAGLLLRPALRAVAASLDYSEHGGAPFLGVRGALIKCHGSSKARAIYNGIRVAREFVRGGGIEAISAAIPADAAEPAQPGGIQEQQEVVIDAD